MSTTSNTHTPGPWHVGHGKAELIVYDAKGNAVADARVFHGQYRDDETAANARLMAAAPEMLEMHRKVMAWLERLAANAERAARQTTFITLREANEADARNYRKVASDIAAVVAKAEGRAP